MITSFGLNVETIVSNTNTSSSTEEGKGFGLALLILLLSWHPGKRCHKCCRLVLVVCRHSVAIYFAKRLSIRVLTFPNVKNAPQDQRQVCMFMSKDQVNRINAAFKVLGARGTSVFGSSGDGGSHFNFGPFSGGGELGNALNEISCQYQMPVFPTTSPYVTSVGGTDWVIFFQAHQTNPKHGMEAVEVLAGSLKDPLTKIGP